MTNLNREKLLKFLYHLGKGMWKAIPLLGPIVEEVFYVQFENELKDSISKLPEYEVNLLLRNLPDCEYDKIEKNVDNISNKLRISNMKYMVEFLSRSEEQHHEIMDRFDNIEEKVLPLINILDVLEQIKQVAGNKQDVLYALQIINERRTIWLNRISKNQKSVLRIFQNNPQSIQDIWDKVQTIIPSCGYKEFRFRLHELEWLSLVSRYRGQNENSWYYLLTKSGEEFVKGITKSE